MVKKGQEVQLEGHKLMYHVNEVSKWLNEEIVAPIYLEIGPINTCNHKCIFCALDYLKSKGKSLDKDILINSLKNMADFGVKSIMFAGEGEPLVYPHIIEATEKAKEFGLDIAITTNGVLFTKEKIEKMLKHLSWIKFSIDAGTKETYSKIHGCREEDFEKVMDNIKEACTYREKNKLDSTIGCQTLLIPNNIEEVEKLIIKVKEIGADYLVLKPYSQHPDSINQLVLDLKKHDKRLTELSEKYSDEKTKIIYRDMSAQEIIDKDISYEECHGINFFTLIDALGNVMPCNLFYEKSEFYYGNLHESTFEEIWKSDKRKKVLKKLHEKGCSNCRKGCRLNFVNKYLDNLKNKKVKHMNFI